MVGNHGTLAEARVRMDAEQAGPEWIPALRGSAVRRLVEGRDMAEVSGDLCSGERPMVCRNPPLAGGSPDAGRVTCSGGGDAGSASPAGGRVPQSLTHKSLI